MSGAPRPRPLPPRARAREWVAAGVCAGAILGLIEVGLLQLRGAALPPRLSLTLVLLPALAVTMLSGAIGLLWPRLAPRPGRSEMVGAVLAPLLLTPALAPVWHTLRSGAWVAAALLLLLALVLASLAGVSGARLGRRLEAAGQPLPGWPLWIAAAAALGLAETAADQVGPEAWALAFGGIALAPALGLVWLEADRQRLLGPPRGWPFGIGVLAAAALALALLPPAAPWLWNERVRLPTVTRDAASLLVLRLPPAPSEDAAVWADPWALLGSEGITYERVLGTGTHDLDALLRLPDGRALASVLYERGYAVAAVVRDPALGLPEGFREADTGLGPLGLLLRHARASTGAGVVLGLGPELRAQLGLGDVLRRPAAVVRAAEAWFVDWRQRRASAPFLVFVDFAARDLPADPAEVDDAIGHLRERLATLGALGPSWAVALRPLPSGPLWRGVQAVVLAPREQGFLAPGTRVSRTLEASELSEALLDALILGPSAAEVPALPGLEATARADVLDAP